MLNQENYKNSSAFTRRSYRIFENKEVEEWKVKALIEAGFATQTARNQKSKEFVVVNDKALIASLQEGNPYLRALDSAPLVILVTSVPNPHQLISPRFLQQELGAVTHQICLMAEELGLGACWCGMHPAEDREELIKSKCKIPDNVILLSLIAVGYPSDRLPANDKYEESKVHYNEW